MSKLIKNMTALIIFLMLSLTAQSTNVQIKDSIGISSYYGGGDGYHGRRTASGEIFDENKLTCAHKTLPFGTKVKVTNLGNSKTLILRVNDRGPFVKGRIIDVSKEASIILGFHSQGVTNVKIEVVDDNTDIVQLVEHINHNDEVGSSILPIRTYLTLPERVFIFEDYKMHP